jgi:hypothetical protein
MSPTPPPAPHGHTASAPPLGHPVEGLSRFFEALSPQALADLGQVYAPQARFKDPFNEVQGLPAIRKLFEDMYQRLDSPRFEVDHALGQGEQGFVVWRFVFHFKGESQLQVIRGASHLNFGPDGLVTLHRDYWDAAEELYEKLPLVGSLMRWLKKKAGGH